MVTKNILTRHFRKCCRFFLRENEGLCSSFFLFCKKKHALTFTLKKIYRLKQKTTIMTMKTILGKTKIVHQTIERSPGNAPLSKGAKLHRKNCTSKPPLEDSERYKNKVKKENEEISRQECINAFIAAEDVAGLKTFLEKLHAVYKKCFIKNTFEYTKKQIVDSGFPDDTKKEIFELIHKVI